MLPVEKLKCVTNCSLNEIYGGKQMLIDFENGYSASIVKTRYSYGGNRGLFELAVLVDDELVYDNEVAQGDVRGHLTEKEVMVLLKKISEFEKI